MAPSEITFVVPSQLHSVSTLAIPVQGDLKYPVAGPVRSGAGAVTRMVAKPGVDVVVLTIANGPNLVLHPENARDLLLAQANGGVRAAAAAKSADEIVVSPQLAWPGHEFSTARSGTRGPMGQALLSGFQVLTGLSKNPASGLLADAIAEKIDRAVDPGVYQLPMSGALGPLKKNGKKLDQLAPAKDGAPLLVLVHGTFVDTASTFGNLWSQHPATVQQLFQGYGGRVYALDHMTLSASPIANALTLVKAMPAGARLHLLTHSRGGLVAEVLSRVCGGGALRQDELQLFEGDKYSQHREDLEQLVELAQSKGLKLERVVRVACPARGTTLASKRLDAYLSILKWGLQLAAVPVAPGLIDFLHQVALHRTDPSELPGLEAMMPESPFVAWLNCAEDILPGELRVVAGDLEGDSVGSWIKTMLADAFYWTDNDLVVQTRSMYGGVPRQDDASGAGAQFLLDRGGKVTHFNYFSNPRTVNAIASALLDSAPAEFRTIGPLSWAGRDTSGSRAAKAVARSRRGSATDVAARPAVFVLPGILGSNLKLDGKRIWLGIRFINGIGKLAWDPATDSRFEPDGPIGSTYDDLIERLADSHEVIPFAYDWRRPVEEEARRLAQAVDKALLARIASGQPVRIIAHSMGGLLARTMCLEAPEVWKRLMAHGEARLLMLGTPNGGSWSPMQTLSGDDTFGNALVAFGSLFDNGGARKVMAGMPGFIQMQAALLDPAFGLDKADGWQKLADQDMAALRKRSIWHWEALQRQIYEWGAPPQVVLDRAVALRRRLDAQAGDLGPDIQKMLLVVGHAAFTPAGIVMDEEGLSYLDAVDDGDGRVTLGNALLPGIRAWKVNVEHGKLPEASAAIGAYIELLTTGQTRQLQPLEQAQRSARTADGVGMTALSARTRLMRNRPSRGLMVSEPPSSEADVLAVGREDLRAYDARRPMDALKVAVLNADLKFIRQPLLIGHYRSSKLTGAEAVIDRLVGSRMSTSLTVGLYPDAPGSHQVFGNHRQNPENPFEMARPESVLVVGLGEEGKLRLVDLAHTVRQAVVAYAQRLSEREDGAPLEFEMAATLIGSGGSGITVGSSAQAITEGAMQANQKLKDSGWPVLSQLTLVELFLDRAADAWRALDLQRACTPNRLDLRGKIGFGPGALRRSLDSDYRGAPYDFISALPLPGGPSAAPCIVYRLDTRRARAEVHAQHAQGSLLRDLVAKASNDANTDPDIGRTLFNLLIPVELEPYLGGANEVVIELAPETAGIPWELLNTNADPESGDERPWSIRSKLIRKLQLKDFRGQVADASPENNVLIIGEPKCDPDRYPRLEGARREAISVARQLGTTRNGIPEHRITKLIDDNDAQTIINALFKHPYRIVHVAGHGEPGPNGGVVLSGHNTYLGANEVNAMRTVPELVFLNCCYLASRDAQGVLKPYDRAQFAANIAEALIRIGVRCVIAAGWAVEDDAAEQFASSFYASLLSGARFIEAVGAARAAAWNVNAAGNTWAAYQCYGDPEWCWHPEVLDAQRPTPSLKDEFASIASPVSLALALENFAIQNESADGQLGFRLDKISQLEKDFGSLWGGMGAVAEAFGLAYASASELDQAIGWYGKAVDAQDGSASFRAAEQLGSLLVRRGEKLDDPAAARSEIETGIRHLEGLLALQPTLERESLLGSAYKRLSMVEWHANNKKQAKAALDASIAHYRKAEILALDSGADNFYYPAKSRLGAELRAAFLRKKRLDLPEERIKPVADSLFKVASEKPDFWSVAGQNELVMLTALAGGRLADVEPVLVASLRDLKLRIPDRQKWDSVNTEARFVLEPYQEVATPPEKEAASSLLKVLQMHAES